ncbi:hypothetical protein [Rhodococcus erythropolis]|uniref:Uncharacterized protein n=1 Tax=Rhodococcus erythropolis TaxID=1833 RepID=A0A8I0ZQ81_RHOER|nr:hypothetical protein [Rhodococcus erythropolis]MBH5141173.1 hypothetical protein [Rhodococcus erythropolis]
MTSPYLARMRTRWLLHKRLPPDAAHAGSSKRLAAVLGARTDQQIRKIDDTFNELGIDIGNHDR